MNLGKLYLSDLIQIGTLIMIGEHKEEQIYRGT